MMHGRNDDERDAMHDGVLPDAGDAALDAVLRRADRGMPAADLAALESRILAAAAFPLAARRRNTRTSARSGMADTLAAWMRVTLPLAAAAALFAVFSLSRVESSATLAEASLAEGDPAALLSALESTGSSGLARHVISYDGGSSIGYELDSR